MARPERPCPQMRLRLLSWVSIVHAQGCVGGHKSAPDTGTARRGLRVSGWGKAKAAPDSMREERHSLLEKMREGLEGIQARPASSFG